MDKITEETLVKYSPIWTVKEAYEYEQNFSRLYFDATYRHTEDEDTIYGDKKMKWSRTTLRSLRNNTYNYLLEDYEVWIKDASLLENESASISDDHIRYAMTDMVQNMHEAEMPLKFRIANGCLVIASDQDAAFEETKEFFEKFYHHIFGFQFPNSDAEKIPDDEDEAEEYMKKVTDEFDKKMKTKLGDRYISGNRRKD